MIKPTRDYILVEITKIKTTESGLSLTSENQKQEFGVIVSSGSEDFTEGQTVYFKSYSGIPITLDSKELFFVKTDEILATS